MWKSELRMEWRCNVVLIRIRLCHTEWRVIFWYWFKCKQIKCLSTWMGLKSVLLLGRFKPSIIVYCNHSHNGRNFFNSKSRRINNVVLAKARCAYHIHTRRCSRTHARTSVFPSPNSITIWISCRVRWVRPSFIWYFGKIILVGSSENVCLFALVCVLTT